MSDIESKIKSIAAKYGQDVIREMISIGELEGSNFANNLKAEVKDDLSLVISYPEYGQYINDGRKAGKMPPVASLKDWMDRKGIPETAAYGIAKTIAINGIKARPFLSALDNSIDKYVEDVAQAYANNVADEAAELLTIKK